MDCAVIADHIGEHPVALMCHVLEIFGIGVRARHRRKPSARAQRRPELGADRSRRSASARPARQGSASIQGDDQLLAQSSAG